MNRSKLSICVVFLVVIGPIAAVPASAEAVAAPALSATAIPTTAVIRGSAPAAQSATANDSSPVVLRGSPPPAAQPLAAEYACPAGYDSDLRRGCVMPDYVYEPNGYRYWPDYGVDGFSPGRRRHAFRHAFAPEIGRGLMLRFGRRLANSFSQGHPHAGFAHR